MVRFRVSASPAQVRDEHLVEAVVPACGNDAALIAVFNSKCAAEKFTGMMNAVMLLVGSQHVDLIETPPRELKYGDD